MKNNTYSGLGHRLTYIYISLVFLILAISLQTLTWLYWGKVLEPRLLREAESQSNVLAHSQAVKLEDAMNENNGNQRSHILGETIDEILLFTNAETDEPFFLGLDLEFDYEVVSGPLDNLNLSQGNTTCRNCFVSEVALYSKVSDELIGIARFQVSDSLFRRLSKDVKKTLFINSFLGILLLLIVWGAVMVLVRETSRSRLQAEMANRAKSAFLANMSHELRTPLNSIIGFSELMSLDPDFSKKHQDNLSIINRSGEYLLELINDILELSRIEADQKSLIETSFELHETLEKVVEMIRPRVEGKNLQLVFEEADDLPRYITTDERKLRQILLNLLGNAVKFTEKGGMSLRVRLNKESKTAQDNFVVLCFEVEDSGTGIDLEDKTKIFEPFTQTRNGYTKKEGTGLGLAISYQFVQQLGGEIWVNSSIGNGTVFTFTICVKPAIKIDVASDRAKHRVIGLKSAKENSDNQSFRILVVDDHRANRALLRLLLEQVGFVVKTAENGKQAVKINTEWQPHLIWMDMRMPLMDGYEAVKTIRQGMINREDKRPVIIALTASAFKEDRQAVLAAGCDDFVRRPFRESEIFSMMGKHLGVDFIYETVEAASLDNKSAGKLSTEALMSEILVLPEEIRHDLKAAIELCDMEHMDRLIAVISADHTVLAEELKELIDTFQYDRILKILAESQKRKRDHSRGK